MQTLQHKPFFSQSALLFLCVTPLLTWSAGIDQLTCYSTLYPPYVIQTDTGLTGIDVETLRAIAKRLNTNLHIALRPWKRLEQELKQGDVDCVFAYFNTVKRREYAAFSSIPLHITNYRLFIRKEDQGRLSSLATLEGGLIGTSLGFKKTPEIEQMIQAGKLQILEMPGEQQSFAMLSRHRLDAVLTNTDVGYYTIHQLSLTDITTMPAALRTEPAYLVVRPEPELQEWLARFNHALLRFIFDGSYGVISAKYRMD